MKKSILDIRTYIRAALLYLIAGVVLLGIGLAVCMFLTNRAIHNLAAKKIDSDLEYWSDSVEGCMNVIEMDARSRLAMTGDSSLVLDKEYFGDSEIQNYAFSDYAKDSYEAGRSSIFDFQQAQQKYLKAQQNMLQTKYEYMIRLRILRFYYNKEHNDENI